MRKYQKENLWSDKKLQNQIKKSSRNHNFFNSLSEKWKTSYLFQSSNLHSMYFVYWLQVSFCSLVSGTKNFLCRIVIVCYSLFCYEHEKPYVPKLRGVVGPVPSLSATSCDAVAKHVSRSGSADVYGRQGSCHPVWPPPQHLLDTLRRKETSLKDRLWSIGFYFICITCTCSCSFNNSPPPSMVTVKLLAFIRLEYRASNATVCSACFSSSLGTSFLTVG